MPWVKILNRRTNAFANKEKIHGLSIEVILIAFFLIIILFLLAVSIKQPHPKKRSGINTQIQGRGEHTMHAADLPAHSIKLKC